MNAIQDTFVFKILTAGDGGVGKTTFVHRFIDNRFRENYHKTIGLEISKKIVVKKNILGREVRYSLVIWDFGGQEQFKILLDDFTKGGNGALLMFDMTQFNSLANIEDWVKIIRKNNGNIPILLLGTKLDLIRKEEMKKINQMANEIKKRLGLSEYIATSSKTGFHIKKVFNTLIKRIIKYFDKFYKIQYSEL
jgi:Ras-related protein Rab-1B